MSAPRLLYLVHCLPPEEQSGTPLVAYGYAHALAARGFEVTVAYPTATATPWELDPERWVGEPFDRVVVPTTSFRGEHWSIDAASDDGTDAPRANQAFLGLLRLIVPDLVHVVNNVHLPLSWPELAHEQGIPVVRSVTCTEDLCGLIAPVSPRSGSGGYCQAPLTPEGCARCVEAHRSASAVVVPPAGRGDGPGTVISVPSASSVPAPDGPVPSDHTLLRAIADQHPRLVDALRHKRARSASQYRRVFDRVVFATPGFRHYFELTLPLDPGKVRVIEMGMELSPWGGRTNGGAGAAFAPLPSAEPGHPVVFCLAAGLATMKGFDAVAEAFTSPGLLRREDYRLVLLGGGDERLVAPMLAANPNISWHGPYRSGDLPELLSRVDVGLSTSYFETFHRVTREYLLAGRPVIGSRAFGIPDIIRPGRNGLLFDHRDAGSLARAVITLLEDRELLATLADGARATDVRSTDDEADELAALYTEVLAEASPLE
jgi:glycosyltransferase involved in cell wall biosynthesis